MPLTENNTELSLTREVNALTCHLHGSPCQYHAGAIRVSIRMSRVDCTWPYMVMQPRAQRKRILRMQNLTLQGVTCCVALVARAAALWVLGMQCEFLQKTEQA